MALFALSPSYLLWLLVYSVCALQAIGVGVGPWGGSGGYQWAYKPKGFISHISISHDIAIHSISFTSQNEMGNFDYSDKFGSTNGTNTDEIDIDIKLERLSSISGTVGTLYSALVITSLSFVTDTNKSFGPFGTATGTSFSVWVRDGYINGFSGNCGWMVDALEVDTTGMAVGPWGGPGGTPWTYLPEYPISRITITHDDAIRSIVFTSQDPSGALHQSPKFGDRDGTKTDQIDIDINVEKLNGISGTYGTYDAVVIVTSLSFTTNTGKVYGPFGSMTGTTFSLPIKDGFIRGFHGRSAWWIDSIGVALAST